MRRSATPHQEAHTSHLDASEAADTLTRTSELSVRAPRDPLVHPGELDAGELDASESSASELRAMLDRWLLVLGSSGGCPGAGRACPGYLVGAGDVEVLLDCGPGVMGRLREAVDYRTVDAVVLSHLHADHFLDLVPYAYGLMMDLIVRGVGEPIPVYAPPGGAAYLREVDALLGHGDWQVSSNSAEGPGYPLLSARMAEAGGLLPAVFDLREYTPEEPLRIGPLQLDFFAVTHTVPTFGVRVTDGSHRLAYTGDTRESPAVAVLAAEADLLLCDASVSQRSKTTFSGHMSAAGAASIAAVANVKRLVLTHVFDQDDCRSRLLDEAAVIFPGPIEIAEELAAYAWG